MSSDSYAVRQAPAVVAAARMFWSIDCWAADATEEGLTGQLKSLVAEKDELNNASPQIPKSADQMAKKGIEDGEASFKVDKVPPPSV